VAKENRMSESTNRQLRVPGKRVVVFAAVIAAFALGYCLPRLPTTATVNKAADTRNDPKSTVELVSQQHSKEKKPRWWTCSMHPWIKVPHPGKCPICGMDLIPVNAASDASADTPPTEYTMSAEAKRMAEVETTPVKRQDAKVVVRMVGQVYEDETRQATLSARVAGRLDAVYIDYTGISVNKGDPMVKIWSPTLIKSQVEMFETMRSDDDESLLKGAEEKLIQYGMTRDQINKIEREKKPDLYVTLRAPISGIVTKKMALLGQFVKEGQDMYMIDDFSKVWVKMDAYESDLPWIRYGQDVTFTTPAVPGRKFRGRVLFIDPVLDTKTRCVKVRVEVDNPDLILKPGMFVSAELAAEVDAKGRVIKSEWAGKYVCPVHPGEKPSSKPGFCQNGKIRLRPASSFGYADEKNPELPLVIPASAPLITGKRCIVYVQVPADRPTYQLRNVALGPRAGEYYVVYSGLKEGEQVVTQGNFKIDSAMQILGKPSMMSPQGPPAKEPEAKKPEKKPQKEADEEVIKKIAAPREFLASLTPVVKEYLNLKEALVQEKPNDAARFGARMEKRLEEVKRDALDAGAYAKWDKYQTSMTRDLKTIAEHKGISDQRQAFDPLSETFAKVIMGFRHVMDKPLVVFFCPMAFNNKGAYWIEGSEDHRNPYFGAKPFKGQSMLKCGELVGKVPPENTAVSAKPDTAAGHKKGATASIPEPGSNAGGGNSGKSHTHRERRDK
jgi:membrane fusion protein, copper/silver efflux system